MSLVRMTTQLKAYQPSVRQKVLWLHAKAFGDSESSPCKPCGGDCCKGCASAHGYQTEENFLRLKELYPFEEFPKEWKWGMPLPKGFLTDKGCALPVEERSGICLGFMCGHREFKKEHHEAANGIYNLMSNRAHLSLQQQQP